MRSAVPLLCALLIAGCATVHVIPISGSIGTNGPVMVTQVAPDGHWVAYCQAREDANRNGRIETGVSDTLHFYGDRPSAYFSEGRAGNGFPIDLWIAADPTGRWVAFVRSGALIVRDTLNHTERNLSTRGAIQSVGGPSARVAFDPSSPRLAFLRKVDGRREPVLLGLRDGAEVALPAGRNLGGLGFDATGQWLYEWPESQSGERSKGSVGSLFVRCTNASRPDFVGAWSPYNGPARAVSIAHPDVVIPGPILGEMGDSLLVSDPSGAILSLDPRGDRTTAVPASCGPEVLFASATWDGLLVSCHARGDRLLVLKSGRTIEPQLIVPYAPARGTFDFRRNERLALLTAITKRFTAPDGVPQAVTQSMLLDLKTATVRPFPYLGIYAIGRRWALVGGPALLELDDDSLHSLPDGSGTWRVRLPWVLVGRTLVNLDTGERSNVPDDIAERAQAVDSKGELLIVHTRRKRVLGALPKGPLQWSSTH